MTHLSRRALRMWQRNADVFLRLWRSEAPGSIFEPLVILLSLGIGLGAYVGLVGGEKYIDFIAPGIIAGYAMFSSTFECTYGSFIRMEYQKTYDAIIATPLSVEDVITGEILWGATRSALTGTIILGVVTAFQLVHSPWALLIPLLAFIEGFMFSSISLSFTAIVPSINTFNYFFTLFVTPMFYFSGAFFPLSSFPQIIQTFSWVVPLTPAVHIARGLNNGAFDLQMLLGLAIIIALSLIFFPMALKLMARRLTV
jgi:lipooligosaccharide transport system permease protein